MKFPKIFVVVRKRVSDTSIESAFVKAYAREQYARRYADRMNSREGGIYVGHHETVGIAFQTVDVRS